MGINICHLYIFMFHYFFFVFCTFFLFTNFFIRDCLLINISFSVPIINILHASKFLSFFIPIKLFSAIHLFSIFFSLKSQQLKVECFRYFYFCNFFRLKQKIGIASFFFLLIITNSKYQTKKSINI